MVLWRVVLSLWLCLLGPVHALAQESAGHEPDPELKRRASEHFEKGVMLYGDGAHRAALIEFERAYETLPDFRLLYNIAHVRMLTEDFLGAMRDYERYLKDGKGQIPPDRIEAVKRELEILRGRIGSIVVRADRPAAKLFIDDTLAGALPMQEPLRLNVGRHKVYVEADDGASATRMIDLAGGEKQEFDLELKAPQVERVGVFERPSRLWPIATTIAAGAFAAATLTTGLFERKAENDLEGLTRTIPASRKDIESTRDRGRALSITTDVFGGVTLALAGVAAYLWLVPPRKADRGDEAQALRVNFGLTGASIARDF